MSLRLATGLEPLNGNRKTPVELEARLLGGNVAAWRRERFERGGLRGGKLERKLKKSEVNHLDVLAVGHPSVSPADKATLWWSSASRRAARALLSLRFQPPFSPSFVYIFPATSATRLNPLNPLMSPLFYNTLRLAVLSTSRVS